MSGGSYDYFCYRLKDFAESVEDWHLNPRREFVRELCILLSKAAHDIEWVDSGDYASGDENRSIDAVINFLKGDVDAVINSRKIKRIAAILEQPEGGFDE